MTAWQYILASLWQYRRVHLAVATGVAVTTAVITGALLVGDSMRGSLRDLALRSLGRVDAAIVAEHPFRAALAGELLADEEVKKHYADAVPLLMTRGAATRQDDASEVRRATSLDVFGVPREFWSLAPGADADASPLNRGNEIALTAAVARELGAKVGDFIVLRLPLASATPADSAIGEKEETSASRRLKVAAILDESSRDSMTRFSLRPTQQTPRNVFVTLGTLQNLLELSGKANAIVLATDDDKREAPQPTATLSAVNRSLQPELVDFGLAVESDDSEGNKTPTYVRISADRLVVPPHVVETAERLFGKSEIQPVVTYLANTIAAGDRKVPYSTVAGVDATAALGPVFDDEGEPLKLGDDEVALNDWTARELNVKVGDAITIRYYEPETTHGQLREAPPVSLTVRAILPLATASGEPTAAADPEFAPDLPGVTDQQSIDAWELPFELVEEVRDEDEAYWDEHRTTPKAFVSHSLGKKLWATRWGTDSVLRLPAGDDRTAESVETALRDNLVPAELGMALLPAKQQALAAASGTTPFDGLFLGFSFFLMASAMMLTALLFRLGVEQRAREVGLLVATGASAARVRRLFAGESLIVAAVGAAFGAAAGVAYAAIMVHGLNTWWVDATAAPFLELHVTPRSVVIGLLAGLAVATATIWRSLRKFAALAPRQLLAGDHQPRLSFRRASGWSRSLLPMGCLVAAVALGIAALRWQGEAQAGAFFGGGALALVGILSAIRGRLREPASRSPQSLCLSGLAARNARRNPSRTMTSLALAATASFLIVALSAFRLAPTERGTGGFDLLANSDLPLHYDLAAAEGRRQLGFADDDSKRLADATVIGFRVRDGEDASCLNLYQTSQPRVLGAPAEELADASEFQWAAVAPLTPPAPSPRRGGLGRGEGPPSGSPTRDADTPPPAPPPQGEGSGTNGLGWRLLGANLGNDASGRPIVPMVLDRNTAMYSLKLYRVGDQLNVRDAFDRPVTLQIVGMLTNSVLQGDVVISETNFLRLYPEVAGQRYFLIRRGQNSPRTGELAALLETQLEDFGFDAVDARVRLGELLAVQNTYLSTFQSLGALGLLLGAVGLAVVQLRSVLERRGELALMQAAGFRRGRLARMVLTENLVLLLGGLAIGTAAALAAVLPHAAVGQVGAPWRTLAMLLAIVAVAGSVAGWWAARSALRAPLIPALRGD